MFVIGSWGLVFKLVGLYIEISMQSIMAQQFLEFVKYGGRCFLKVSYSGHIISKANALASSGK